MKRSARGFTLIELLVVIAIIGVLSTLAIVALSGARTKARDSKRVADMKQIATALELYFSDNGSYPTIITPGQSIVSPDGNTTYMSNIPSNPTPRNDGDCPNNDYSYAYSTSSNKYALGFCLGNSSGTLAAGVNTAATDTGLGNAGLVGYWKFDEGSGTTAYDSSGNNNNATWHGSGTQYVSGKLSLAGNLADNDDYLTMANNVIHGSKTITAWVYQNNRTCVNQAILGGYLAQIYDGYLTHYNGSSYLVCTSAIPQNSWTSVAWVFDQQKNTISYYINGDFKNSFNNPSFSNNTNIIGKYSATLNPDCETYAFSGKIDELRIYNRALSDAEVIALYNATQ